MFNALPEDLAVMLLSEWLDISLLILSRLDVAFCGRASRQSWQVVLAKLRLRGARFEEQIRGFMAWMHDRRLAVDDLSVVLKARHCTNVSAWPQFSVLANSLTLHLPQIISANTTIATQKVLDSFPNLTSLRLDCMSLHDQNFPEIRVPLRDLVLMDHASDAKFTSAKKVSIIAALCSSLEGLACSVDDWMLTNLAEVCQRLTGVAFICDRVASQESMTHFCRTNPLLSHVCLYDSSDEVGMAVLSECPQLQEIEIDDGSMKLLITMANAASTSARNLARVQVRNIVCTFGLSSSDRQQRCCDIVVVHYDGWDNMDDLVSALTIPIRRISLGSENAVISEFALEMLHVLHGHALEVVQFLFWDDFDPIQVQTFLMHCPNLTELSFTAIDESSLIDNDALRKLPMWCPRISKLELIRCAIELTDDSIGYALEKWSANKITVLNLDDCSLTDAVLPKIAQHCPHLISLSVERNLLSKEALLAFRLEISKNQVFKNLKAPDEVNLQDC